jgi:hypothetical protein
MTLAGANASPARRRDGAQENPACRPRERRRDGARRGRRGGCVPCAARMRYPMGAPGRGCRGGLTPAGSAGPAAGDWLSGRAPRSHRGGHWFDPSIAHRCKSRSEAPLTALILLRGWELSSYWEKSGRSCSPGRTCRDLTDGWSRPAIGVGLLPRWTSPIPGLEARRRGLTAPYWPLCAHGCAAALP